ncbi:MAG TPA: preprotein translocase subunit SecE [Candidatus Spyradocola merdavium]|nr:preprotein translocase subunit SecE [Candidatus Spyradocola merdavium]
MAEKKAVAKTTDKKAAAKKSDSGKKRFNLVKTFKDMWAELKKVTWPSRKDLIRQSTVVIVFVLILTVVVGLMDYVLSNLLRLIIS